MPKFSGLKQHNYLTASVGQESGSTLAGCLYFRVSYEVLVKTLVRTTVIWRLAWSGGEFGCKLIHRTDGKTPQFQTGNWSKASVTQYVGFSTGLFTRQLLPETTKTHCSLLWPKLASDTLPRQPCVGCGKGLHTVKTLGGRASWGLSWRLESFLLINLL